MIIDAWVMEMVKDLSISTVIGHAIGIACVWLNIYLIIHADTFADGNVESRKS